MQRLKMSAMPVAIASLILVGFTVSVSSLAEDMNAVATLTYHVVSGEVMAKDVVTLSKATTVNGVVHVIDTVLLPQ
jgi:uncharacterized surface protein with fasciclin (FAS1) repeats